MSEVDEKAGMRERERACWSLIFYDSGFVFFTECSVRTRVQVGVEEPFLNTHIFSMDLESEQEEIFQWLDLLMVCFSKFCQFYSLVRVFFCLLCGAKREY